LSRGIQKPNVLGMAYRIEYFKEGAPVIAVPWTGSLHDTIEIVKRGIVSRGVDFARVIDVYGKWRRSLVGGEHPSNGH
jgi:hypothetical protein